MDYLLSFDVTAHCELLLNGTSVQQKACGVCEDLSEQQEAIVCGFCTILLGTSNNAQAMYAIHNIISGQVEGAFTEGGSPGRSAGPHPGASAADSQSGEGAEPVHQPAHGCAGGRGLHGGPVCGTGSQP